MTPPETPPDPITMAQASVRQRALQIAGGVAGVSVVALLAAGAAAPLLAAPVATLAGLGGNALASWLVDWAKGRLTAAGALPPEVSLEDLARDLDAAAQRAQELAAGVAQLLGATQAVQVAVAALQTQGEAQLELLEQLEQGLAMVARRGDIERLDDRIAALQRILEGASRWGDQITTGDIQAQAPVAIGAGARAEQHLHLPPAIPTLHQLRAPVGDFVGREREIAELARALRGVDSRAAAISGLRGMGGVGKTELALKVAQEVASDFPDAQLLLPLSGAGPSPLSAAQALQAAIRAFEREAKLPEDVAQLQRRYVGLLSGKRALILADDAKDAAQVRALLPPPGCALLVTSRTRFSLPAMHALDLGAMPAADAVALLLAICPRIGDDAAALAQLCGRLPLALRISASLLLDNPGRPVARYLEQLRAERLKYLRDPEGDPDDPQASVAASIALSFVALPAEAQAALATLSVFVGSFDEAAALAVLEAERGEAALELLVRRSLLELAEGRYEMHDLVRTFAARHLSDAESAGLRHARYYLVIAEQAEYGLFLKGDALTGLELFDLERAQIDVAWAWVLARGGQAEADELLLALADATVYIGNLRDDLRRVRIPRLKAQRDAAQRLGRRDAEGAALGNLGRAYSDLGEQQTAISYFEQDLSITRERGDRLGEGATLGGLGNVYRYLGEKQKAADLHKQRLDIMREVGNQRGEGNALGDLGTAYVFLGEIDNAIDSYEQAISIMSEVGDWHGLGNILSNLGNVYAFLGEVDKAIATYEYALSIMHELGDRARETLISWNLGDELSKLGDLVRAVALMQTYVDYQRAIGHADAERDAQVVEALRRRIAGGEAPRQPRKRRRR